MQFHNFTSSRAVSVAADRSRLPAASREPFLNKAAPDANTMVVSGGELVLQGLTQPVFMDRT